LIYLKILRIRYEFSCQHEYALQDNNRMITNLPSECRESDQKESVLRTELFLVDEAIWRDKSKCVFKRHSDVSYLTAADVFSENVEHN
jgi:hypothetical protein